MLWAGCALGCPHGAIWRRASRWPPPSRKLVCNMAGKRELVPGLVAHRTPAADGRQFIYSVENSLSISYAVGVDVSQSKNIGCVQRSTLFTPPTFALSVHMESLTLGEFMRHKSLLSGCKFVFCTRW
jgi:hypothetical protein